MYLEVENRDFLLGKEFHCKSTALQKKKQYRKEENMRSIIRDIEGKRKQLDDKLHIEKNLTDALSISQELDILIAEYIEKGEAKQEKQNI